VVAVTADDLKADGWTAMTVEGFSGTVAPFWFRRTEGVLSIGLITEPRHANNHIGTLHGGAIMTFGDIAGGFAVADVLGHTRCATVHLHTYFTSTGKIGEFVHCTPEVTRHARDLVFVRGLIKADERNIASIEGMWKVLQER
jgi:acyl-coenzyme A thioesterase PaaI-like protein